MFEINDSNIEGQGVFASENIKKKIEEETEDK